MFLNKLRLEADDARPDYWTLTEPLVWSAGDYIVVPKGTRTDLASIPRIFRNLPIFDPNGPARKPAVLHDYLYQDGRYGKAFADDLLRRALIAEGMSKTGAAAYYYGVAWFGWKAWDDYRYRCPKCGDLSGDCIHCNGH